MCRFFFKDRALANLIDHLLSALSLIVVQSNKWTGQMIKSHKIMRLSQKSWWNFRAPMIASLLPHDPLSCAFNNFSIKVNRKRYFKTMG